jgi:competence protein ComGC
MTNFLRQKKAFSLPEVMLAIFLLASIILLFILSYTIGKYATQLSKERLIAVNLLREDLEIVLDVNYSSIDALAGSQNIVINDGLKNYFVTKTLSVLTVDPAIYGYKEIYARVEWTGGITRNRVLAEEMVLYVTKK